jgi:hypothetical protein
MTHDMIVRDAIGNFKANYAEAIALAETLTLQPIFDLQFLTPEITPAWISQQLQQLRTGYPAAEKEKCSLYVFTVQSAHSGAELFDAMRASHEQRGANQKRNVSAINLAHAGSRVMYVGRSFKPRARMKQHLEASVGGTYAMHLGQWATGMPVAIDLRVYDVVEYRPEPAMETAMSILETGMWNHLRPLLGRRGDK